jgi:Skp family chaperone for outer membrane proteins
MKRNRPIFSFLRCRGTSLAFSLSLCAGIGFACPSKAKAQLSAPDRPTQVTKTQVLDTLKNLEKRELEKLEQIDKDIRKKLAESQDLRIQPEAMGLTEIKFDRFGASLDKLQAERREHNLRREFFDQLVFQVDTKWDGTQQLKEFFGQRLLDMALADLSGNPGESGALWKFEGYLSVALREISELREDSVAFIDGYIQFSTLSNPKSPYLYLSERNYTDGSTSIAAHPVSADKAADGLDKKLRALGLIEPKTRVARKTKSDADIELRFKNQLVPTGKTQSGSSSNN